MRGSAGLTALVILFSSHLALANARLIGGTVVPSGEWEHVVTIRTGNAMCTATVVGPRTILTAAHCGNSGQTARFSINGNDYSAKLTRHPKYNDFTVDYDLSLGVTSQDIVTEQFSTINKQKPEVGDGITLLGYGCTRPNGSTDGKLRIGESVITEFRSHDFGSYKQGGATLCPGDSGGPAFVQRSGKMYLAGVNSTVTTDYRTSYNERTDLDSSFDFFNDFASQNSVEICGVNKDCTGADPEPPKCQLAVSPAVVKEGERLTFKLTPTGDVTSARIGSTAVSGPNWVLTQMAGSAGNYTETGTVTGPGGTGTCTASYEVQGQVDPNPPSCTLAANPKKIKVGENLLLTLSAKGNVTSAKINGNAVPVPVGSAMVQGTTKGQFQALGEVSGPGGTAQCMTSYSVDDGTIQPIPDYAAVPTLCGANIVNTPVAQACFSKLKLTGGDGLEESVIVTYKDGTKELLPVFASKPSSTIAKDTELTLYSNSSYIKDGLSVLSARTATVTYDNSSGSPVPTYLIGRTTTGYAFVVDSFQ